MERFFFTGPNLSPPHVYPVPALLPWTSNTYHDHDDASLLHYDDLTFCEKIGDGAFGIVYRSLLWGQVYRDGGHGLYTGRCCGV